jgi:hypothetical protein
MIILTSKRERALRGFLSSLYLGPVMGAANGADVAGIRCDGDDLYSFAITNDSTELLSFESFENGHNLPRLVDDPENPKGRKQIEIDEAPGGLNYHRIKTAFAERCFYCL